MITEEQLVEQLEDYHVNAAEGFTSQVMAALPTKRPSPRRRVAPIARLWLFPALGGAVVMMLLLLLIAPLCPRNSSSCLTVHFQLHAPGAERVELLGTFNNWQSGDIVLEGPDGAGHWSARVELPTGQHEYIFLVDGRYWVADPNGTVRRSDHLGRMNTVIRVCDHNDA